MTTPASLPVPSALRDARAREAYAPAEPVLHRLRDAGHEAYLVGGGIRDLLLGRSVRDWDIATSARPEAVIALFPRAVPTGIRHGTVTLPLDSGAIEITTYRTEGPYADGRRPDWVRLDATLAEDLSRRDFTVNAMAFDPGTGHLFDPEGGLADLAARRLRTVGDPDLRFQEDGLRPVRGIRFAAVLEMDLDPPTLAAIGRSGSRVAGVAPERIQAELRRLMEAPRPSVGIELLRRTGLLEVLLPELLEGVEMEQNRYHAYTVYRHTLETLDAAPAENPRVRFAALFHDIGKPRTLRVVDGEGTFHNHEFVGGDLTRTVLDRLRFPHAERDDIAHLVEQHMFHYTPEWSDAAVRRFLRKVGGEHVEDLFALRRADDRGHGTGLDREHELVELGARVARVQEREDALQVTDLAIDGEAVMRILGIGPGPEVGRILGGLLEQVLERPELNEPAALENLLRKPGTS